MKTQTQAVVSMVINLAKERNYDAQEYETRYEDVLSKDDVRTIVGMVFTGFKNGEIAMSEKSQLKFLGDGTPENPGDDKKLRQYAINLVSDRIRKAKILNGNTIYQYKEPGKLTGSRDPQLKALTQVLALHQQDPEANPETEVEIKEAIAKRTAEINAEKIKKVTINVEHLPADLRAKLGI